LLELAGDRFHLRLSFGYRHAGFEPPDNAQQQGAALLEPEIAARPHPLMHRNRHPEVRRKADIHSSKSRRGDANYGEGVSIEGNLTADNRRIGSQFSPELVTEYDDRMTVRR
jgi:hypothetical protein